MGHPGVRARRWRTPAAALAAALFLLALGTLHMSPQGADAWGPGGVALSAVLALALSQSRSRPLPALAVVTGLFLVAQASYGLVPVFAMMVVVAVFLMAAADRTPRVWAASAASVVAVAVDVSAQLTRHDSWTNSAYLVMATAVLGSAAAGDAARSRRAYVREVEDRARRAEHSRDQTVQRRIIEERLKIARDVHDLVAHHLAVVSVQAEVANHLIESHPVLAKNAVGLVRDAASSALGELGSLIGVSARRAGRPARAGTHAGATARADDRVRDNRLVNQPQRPRHRPSPARRGRPRRIPAGSGIAHECAQARVGTSRRADHLRR